MDERPIPDDECTMWTVGAFCDPQLDPIQEFQLTDVMAGPSHEIPNISKMIVDLGLGDGQCHIAQTPADARTYMLDSMMERFAFGAATAGVVGHMVNAYRVNDELEFLDFQISPHTGTPVNPPEGPQWVYAIFPIKDPD